MKLCRVEADQLVKAWLPGAVIISDTVQEVFVIIGNAIWPVK